MSTPKPKKPAAEAPTPMEILAAMTGRGELTLQTLEDEIRRRQRSIDACSSARGTADLQPCEYRALDEAVDRSEREIAVLCKVADGTRAQQPVPAPLSGDARGAARSKKTPWPAGQELRAAEVAEKYGMSQSAICKATKLPADDPMHLASRRDERAVFIQKSVAKKWADNYEARARCRQTGAVGSAGKVKMLLQSLGNVVNRNEKDE